MLLAALAFAGLLLWRRAGSADALVAGRPGASLSARRSLALASIALAIFLFVSPFCAATSALFSVRSVHHVALTALLAPLLVAAVAPRRPWPGGLGAWTLLANATFWLWHVPALYAWALSSDAVYWLMQASLGATAFGFWSSLRHAAVPAAVGALLVTMVAMGLLAALLLFAPVAFYAPHALTTSAWGLSPIEDQQLAGLIMWVPGAAIYLLAALVRVQRLFGAAGQRVTA